MPKSKLINEINNINQEPKNVSKNATTAKKGTKISTVSAKKTSTTAKATTRSSTTTKKVATTAKSTAKSTATKKVANTSKTSSKKATTKNASVKKTTAKKTSAKKTSVKKTTAKKATTKKAAVKKANTSTRKKSSNTKSPLSKNVKSKVLTNIVEYYDLPYTYDKTNVKLLYQNPNTLFVYWDVSSKDTDNFKKLYGENFLNITHPVLIVHNKTNDYTFEIDINDFANNWYIHVDDPKCKYEVKLGRRPTMTSEIKNEVDGTYSNFIDITSSNTVEMPNDHVLFYKNNQVLKFKNIKTNSIKECIYKIGNMFSKSVKSIYNNYNLDEINNSFDFKNPSSNNPSSNVM